MNKKYKIGIILGLSLVLLLWWAYMYINNIKAEAINYWWQAGLALISIVTGFFGLLTAKKWSWLKSGMGKGVFFISLGLIMWGIGQAGWSYYTIVYPGQEVVYNKAVDLLYFASIPFWIYGIFSLSKATGAKFGLKSSQAKILSGLFIILMSALSYYLLIEVARGGTSYFDEQTLWNVFFDLAYAIGDAINLILAATIFGLSWKFLGGRFKKPIIIILSSFVVLYIADLAFSYLDGKGLYYNGNVADLLYLLVVALMGVGLNMLDPSILTSKPIAYNKPENINETSQLKTEPSPATSSLAVEGDNTATQDQQESNSDQVTINNQGEN